MKQRMSRDHSERKEFKVDSILNNVIDKRTIENKKISNKFGNLIIQLTGIQDKTLGKLLK